LEIGAVLEISEGDIVSNGVVSAGKIDLVLVLRSKSLTAVVDKVTKELVFTPFQVRAPSLCPE
jgi:hypothetical protein